MHRKEAHPFYISEILVLDTYHSSKMDYDLGPFFGQLTKSCLEIKTIQKPG
ncbi:hypothetical protein [Gramella sp. MAR_2010_147]|uniref:hypothetical protein n=1 Tax=Gramella sp. MAR_2010_147 TaxID=1250205 RepID=UPI00087B8514|nr:hypothetical protein [Gramella sp. MAR_2010_147]SDS65018.1 hypothetical protein SAMN04488553_2758 [Gramella sp. MAR_2010_147]